MIAFIFKVVTSIFFVLAEQESKKMWSKFDNVTPALSGGYIVQFTPHFMCWIYFDENFMNKDLLHISLTKFNKLKESAPF